MNRTSAARDRATETPQKPRTAPHNQTLGARGEALAATYLEAQGFHILDRNWHSGHGEIDLVALDEGVLVAVEVKARSGTGYGNPLTAITARKTARLGRLLLDWARTHDVRNTGLRIDAIGITLRAAAAAQIDHIRGIS